MVKPNYAFDKRQKELAKKKKKEEKRLQKTEVDHSKSHAVQPPSANDDKGLADGET